MTKEEIKQQIRATLQLGCKVSAPYKRNIKSWIDDLSILKSIHEGKWCLYGCIFEEGELEPILDKFVDLIYSKSNLVWALRWIETTTGKDLDRIPEDEMKQLVAQFKKDKTLTVPILRR